MKIDHLVRSRRKTVALLVRPDGSLEVRAPVRLNLAVIQEYVDRHAAWVEKHRQKMVERQKTAARRPLADGARLWLLGKPLVLRVIPGSTQSVTWDGALTLGAARLPQAADLVAIWYREQARSCLSACVADWAARYNFRWQGLRITSARTRWGSCSPANTLSFPWRLVMAPPEIIDYVVVHELAHTRVKNHSRAFWEQVEKILPDYRARRTWLRKNGALLDLAVEADESALR